MSEPKTQCAACGAGILKRTADEHDGLCVPCHRKAAAIPPDDFQIAPELGQRLVSINEDPIHYRQMAWRHGVEFVHGLIDKLEEQNGLYHEWSPRLREFAKRCREEHPPPGDGSLSSHDRAIQQICEGKISNAERLPHKTNQVTICCMPLVAIPVAQRLWPGYDDGAVLLTPQENSRWSEIYSHPQDSFWWFVHYWWNIDESPQQEFSIGDLTISNWDGNDVSKGCCPWLVTSGLQWGPLFGGSNTELWSWDGARCKLIKTICHVQF